MRITIRPQLHNKVNKDGQSIVVVRITNNGQSKYVSVGLRISPHCWNPRGIPEKANWVRANHPLATSYNRLILQALEKIYQLIADLTEVNQLTLHNIGQRYLNPETRQDFQGYYLQYIENRCLTTVAASKHKVSYQRLLTYKPQLDYQHLTVNFLHGYHKYLLKQEKLAPTTAARAMGYLKQVIRAAVLDKQLLNEDNPFHHFKISTPKVERAKLSQEQLQKLAKANLSPAHSMVRDIFMFQFYLNGARISDAMLLKKNAVQDNYIIYNAQKDGKQRRVKLSPQLQEIINRYAAYQAPSEYLLPSPFTKHLYHRDVESCKVLISYMNKMLKRIATELEIPINLSTHVARHTFAELARQHSGDIYGISKALGHTTIQITEGYLKHTDQKAIDRVSELTQNLL